MANPSIQSVTASLGGLLYSGQLSTTSPTSVYTVPANKTAKITQGSLCNISGASVAVSLALLKSGDTDGGTHNIISGYLLSAGETLLLGDFLSGHFLAEAESISVTAGTASVIDVVVSGVVSS